MSQRLDAVLRLNPGFKEALIRQEPWAVQYAEQVRGIDGEANTRHPDRIADGKSRNWCGTCPFADGCITCDLDGDYVGMKGFIGAIATYEAKCNKCNFSHTVESANTEKTVAACQEKHDSRRRQCSGIVSLTRIPGPFTSE